MLKDLLRGKPRDITPKNRCGCFDSLGGSGSGGGGRVVMLSAVSTTKEYERTIYGETDVTEATAIRLAAFPADGGYIIVPDFNVGEICFETPDGEILWPNRNISPSNGDVSFITVFNYSFDSNEGYRVSTPGMSGGINRSEGESWNISFSNFTIE